MAAVTSYGLWKPPWRDLQYSSQIVETDTIWPEFCRKFLTSTFRASVLTQMCPAPSPILTPHVFWSTETTVIPKATLGKGKHTRLFQDFWRVLKSFSQPSFVSSRNTPSREETKISSPVPHMNPLLSVVDYRKQYCLLFSGISGFSPFLFFLQPIVWAVQRGTVRKTGLKQISSNKWWLFHNYEKLCDTNL